MVLKFTNKDNCRFTKLGKLEFYPSVSEILKKSINFAENMTNIDEHDESIIQIKCLITLVYGKE